MKKAFTSLLLLMVFSMSVYAQTMVAVGGASNSFSPADITIEVGETVQWDNTGGFHNINGSTGTYSGNPEGFANGAASSANWTFSHTFNIAGSYNYQCDPHAGSGMVGTITVNPALPANIVITEIMYNTPGNDDFEFLELYNAGSTAENLEGYYFTSGIEDTIGAVTLDPGAYLVLAQFPDNMLATFGVTAEQWFDNNLNNSGESIVLRNPAGEVVDSVAYSDDAPYHEICDGEGPSLELCDVNADNSDPANWGFSTTNTGVNYGFNQQTIFSSAGFANNTCAAVPYIFLDASERLVNEGDGTYNLGINLANIGMMDTTDVTFMVSGTSTATDGDDYSIPNLTVNIGGDGYGSKTFGSLAINIVDDADVENAETVELTIAMASNGVVLATSTFTLTIEDNDGLVYNEYDIATVTTNMANGEPDSLGVVCQLQGIVHGVDMQGNDNIQFTMIDATGGISLFSSNNFDYTVTEGDEVIVQGVISQFSGLTQITPDTVIFVSANNTLETPLTVTALGEDTESELVKVEGVTIVNAADWDPIGSGFNADFSDGTNTYTIRIDADVDLFNTPAPEGCVDITGLGGQFDNSDPFDSGYQLLPRYTLDIAPCGGGSEILANDDMVTTDINEAINIEVLSNDVTPNGFASIAIDQMAANGGVVIEADNSITYDPIMDFCGTDEFSYIICDATADCDTATVTIEVVCPSVYTPYPIAQINTVDAEGIADSLGVLVEITGVVYGVDLQGNENIQFTIIDKFNPDAGIGLFSTDDYGYTVTEGDEIIVQGAISQFRGLTQINPDTLWTVDSGIALHEAEIVTVLSEDTESKLVKFEGMHIVDVAEWDNMGTGLDIEITNGSTDTILMRIDNDVDLYSMTPPAFPVFNVTGLGGQFDFEAPFDEGYQLLPRYAPDIEEFVSVIDPTIAEGVSFYPNPVANTLFIEISTNMDQLSISNVLGQQVMLINNPENLEEINVSDLASGMYVLTFVNGEKIWSTQFVKE